MDILNIFRRKPQATAPQVHAQSDGQFIGFDDPRFKEWMRNGGDGVASPISIEQAMRNTAVFRCVSLISYSIGMLPMHVIDTETKEKARESGLFSLLHSMPNDWQTAFTSGSICRGMLLFMAMPMPSSCGRWAGFFAWCHSIRQRSA